MKDVFILGAGFSKEIHSGMPTLADLTVEVTTRLQGYEGSLPEPLTDIESNIELWIAYLSSHQPWLTEYENDSNKSLAGRIRHHIGEVIEEHTARASQSEAPEWLIRLITSWHRERATVITLNYDTLVERASKQVRATEKLNRILAAQMYPPYFSDVQARAGVGLWGEGSLSTFLFLKLHGSINWYYSGRDDFFGEPILFSEDLPFGDPVWNDVGFRRPQSRDKEPLIIPPATDKSTYFNNETVRRLWREAGIALQEAERVFIIGYSLPASDQGMKFFFTKHRPNRATPVYLVNTDGEAVAHYQQVMSWNVRAEFIDTSQPIVRLAAKYPKIA